jgi:hypothetical protein
MQYNVANPNLYIISQIIGKSKLERLLPPACVLDEQDFTTSLQFRTTVRPKKCNTSYPMPEPPMPDNIHKLIFCYNHERFMNRYKQTNNKPIIKMEMGYDHPVKTTKFVYKLDKIEEVVELILSKLSAH